MARGKTAFKGDSLIDRIAFIETRSEGAPPEGGWLSMSASILQFPGERARLSAATCPSPTPWPAAAFIFWPLILGTAIGAAAVAAMADQALLLSSAKDR
jgi:hypothetical protein